MRQVWTIAFFVFGLVDPVVQPTYAFDCVELKCGQMTSCAEAHHKLTVCGHTKRDRDGDGIPCEKLCGKTQATYQARVQRQLGDRRAEELDVKKKARSTFTLVGPANADGARRSRFVCRGKRQCAQMLSCDEARFYLIHCGVRSLDRDGDGRPCNALCRNGR